MTGRRPRVVVVIVAWVAIVTGGVLGAGISRGSAAGLTVTSQSLTPYRTCTITATPSTTSSVVDATVRQSNPTTNFGTLTTETVQSASGTANQRTYLRFDLTGCSPGIPATAVVRLATLRLYLTTIPATCRTIDIFPATTAWTETTLTWNNQPFGTATNNPPSASRTGSFGVGTPAGCPNQAAGYVSGADVTTDVAGFVAGTSPNNGWMLRDDAEGSATTRTAAFASKEAANLGRAPQLVVTYVVVP